MVIFKQHSLRHGTGLFLLLVTLTAFSKTRAIAQGITGTDTLSLDGSWQFKTDPDENGEAGQWYLPTLNTCSWDSMQVPGNWDLKNQYSGYAGKAWYRRSFSVLGKWKGKFLRLFFEYVSHDSKVWLNGKLLGEDHFGFLPFHYDISPYVNFGGSNVLVVETDNTFKRGALWNWGGLNRPLRIEATGLQRLGYQHVTAIPDLQKGQATVSVAAVVENHSEKKHTVDLEYSILYNGQIIRQKWKKNIVLTAGKPKEEKALIYLSPGEVHLWDFDHPNLYHSTVSLYENGKLIHSLTNQFGVRKIEVDGYHLKLNGESIRPVGFNLVPDDRTTGNTLPLWRIKEDVDLMKSVGANMARLSHVPLPKEFLDYLDKKGILVFSEFPLWGKDRWVDPDNPIPFEGLKKLISTQYNHPAVIGWSVGNEIGYAYRNPKVMAYVKAAIDYAGTLDSTRLIAYVSNSAKNQQEDPAKYENFILLNTYGNFGESARRANRYFPGKPIFFSEYGKHIISEDPDKGALDARGILDDMRGKEYLIGGSLWTFDDYRSGFTGTAVSQNRAWGIVNVYRQPKRAFFSFQKEYAPVKDIRVHFVKSNEKPSVDITVVPRSVLDIPAYTLNGYKILWAVYDENERISQGSFFELPQVKPGDAPFTRQIALRKIPQGNAALKITLLTPGSYAVYDTTIYLAPPSSPVIKAVYSSQDVIRLEYDKVPFAEGYEAVYDSGGSPDTTDATIDNFIEIPHLDRNKKYHFRVIAVNNFANSEPSAEREAKLNNNELPPVIWKTVPADHSFFIGYSVLPDDYLFEVEYGTHPGNYTHHLGVKNKGVLQVPGLKNGLAYYYRLRSRKQWGFKSEWSPEVEVVPDGGLNPPAPKLLGVLRQGEDAVVCFEPVPKAINYEVNVHRANGTRDTILVNGGHVAYASIKALGPWDNVSIRAINHYGKSGEAKILEK